MNKELSKYIAVFCHFGKASILLSVRSSGVSIVVFFDRVLGAPAGTVRPSFSFSFLINAES